MMDNSTADDTSDVDMTRFLYFSKKLLLSRPSKSLIEQCKTIIDNSTTTTSTSRDIASQMTDMKNLIVIKEKELKSMHTNEDNYDSTINTTNTSTYTTTNTTNTTNTNANSIINNTIKKHNTNNSINDDITPFDDTTSAEKIQNLLIQQKTILSKELEDEKRSQDILALELADLTNVLKEATLNMHQSVYQQNIQLDQIQHHAVENVEELERQKKKMTEREKVMKSSIWGTFGSIIWVIVLFIVTYIVIRLFPKPK